MNALSTLLWLEVKRTAWVLYGTAVGLVLFTMVLLALPGVSTGLDALNIPVQGEEQCVPPDCTPSGNTRFESTSETDGEDSSFSFQFSKSWGDEPEPVAPNDQASPAGVAGQGQPTAIKVPIPEELQMALRPRQIATFTAALGIVSLMLLCFLVAHSREADGDEMSLLYQSPVSGDYQLWVRFAYMSVSALLAIIAVIAIYWSVQVSQSFAPLAPVVEAFGGRVHIQWANFGLACLVVQVIPGAAFALLYVQSQNAYNLMGGQRQMGLVLILTAISIHLSVWTAYAPEAESTGSLLQIVSVESTNALNTAIDNFNPSTYTIEIGAATLGLSAAISALMLFIAGRIWREVEWS